MLGSPAWRPLPLLLASSLLWLSSLATWSSLCLSLLLVEASAKAKRVARESSRIETC